MLQAKDSSTGRLVLASNAKYGRTYLCPECGEDLILRSGQCIIEHFAHHPGTHCYLGTGETNEHLLGKRQLYQWALEHSWHPKIEHYFVQIKQRPDLLIEINQHRVALEFQCSPLSYQRMMERNQGYKKLGIAYRWLLGSPYNHKLSNSKIAQFTQYVKNKPLLIFWNTKVGQVRYKDCSRVSFLRRIPQNRNDLIIGQTKLLQFSLRRQNQKIRKLVMLAYQHRHLLAAMPLVAHDWQPRWPVLHRPVLEWRVLVLLMLESFPLGYQWPAASWRRWLFEQGEWLAFPCLTDNGLGLVRLVIDDFALDLISDGVLGHAAGLIILKKYPVWFASPETKLGFLTADKWAI